jgi:hypothetical protein
VRRLSNDHPAKRSGRTERCSGCALCAQSLPYRPSATRMAPNPRRPMIGLGSDLLAERPPVALSSPRKTDLGHD